MSADKMTLSIVTYSFSKVSSRTDHVLHDCRTKETTAPKRPRPQMSVLTEHVQLGQLLLACTIKSTMTIKYIVIIGL